MWAEILHASGDEKPDINFIVLRHSQKFSPFCPLLSWAIFFLYPANFLFRVNEYMDPMSTFTVWVKSYPTELGWVKFFVHAVKIFGCMVILNLLARHTLGYISGLL